MKKVYVYIMSACMYVCGDVPMYVYTFLIHLHHLELFWRW